MSPLPTPTGRRPRIARLLPLLLLFTSSCQPVDEETSAGAAFALDDPTLVLATISSGEITVADVDRFAGRLGPRAQPDASLSAAARYRSLARRVAVERLLLERARALGIDEDPEIRALSREQRRLAVTEHYLRSTTPYEAITEEALRERFESEKGRFDRGEQRRVSHIFLRYPADGDREPVRARLEGIRRQILDGRPFEQMAREHSDSETRHQDGRIGFVARGKFPPDFDRVVFALEPEAPSEVISTRDGVHLFYVHTVLPARDVSYEDVRGVLAREEQLERRWDRLREAAAGLPEPANAFLAEPDELLGHLQAGNRDAVVLRLGEVQVTAGELREQLQPIARQLGDVAGPSLPHRWLEEVRHRELLYQDLLAREEAGETFEVPEAELELARRRQIAERTARLAMRERLEEDPERLERYRAANALRFATPLELRLQRLRVPLGNRATERMARLESARDELDRGELTLSSLATELGGRVQALGPITIAELQAADPPSARFAALLQTGEHSPPYVAEDGLALFAVTERVEPEALPLEAVRERVIEDILESQAAALFEEIAEALLVEAAFEWGSLTG